MSEFRITEPGEYATRDGEKATVEFKLPGKEETFPWIGWVDDMSVGCSTWNGGGMNCSTYPGPNDIVGPWVEPPKPVVAWAVLNSLGTIILLTEDEQAVRSRIRDGRKLVKLTEVTE